MRRLAAAVTGFLAAVLLLTGTTLALVATGPAATGSSAGAEGSVRLEDAVLRWAINDQSNARSHNPAAINFLSAGTADPGGGASTLPRSRWKARAGAVEIQKRAANGRWRTATWAGLGTDATGAPIDLYGPFSGHRVSFTGGVGSVDPVADTADLSWQGTVTVVYYAGNSVFTLSDPRLEVTDGVGRLTADLGGWASGREDMSVWQPVDPVRVTVADLPEVDLTEDGAVALPAYAGVRVDGTVPQERDGEHWGSFPSSMVAALMPLGVDQFWYSTGLTSDWTKVPAPVVVGYGGTAPEAPEPSATPSPQPTPTNEVRQPPPAAPPGSAPPGAAPPAVPAPVPPQAAALVPAEPPATVDQAAPMLPLAAPVQVSAQPRVALASSERSADPSPAPWWIGGALLLAAMALLLLPAPAPS